MKSDSTKHLYIKWDEFYQVCQKLAVEIAKHSRYDQHRTCLWGIARGGLVPATTIAYCLNLDHDHLRSLRPRYKPYPHMQLPQEYDFIIDSLFDTGKTYYDLVKWFPNTNWGMVYCKTKLPPNDVLVGKKLKSNDWLIFPWEE